MPALDNLPRPYRVEVLVDAPATTARERIGRYCTIEEVDAGRCRVRMTTHSLDWPIMSLGVLGAEFRVIEPPELLDRIHDWGARFQRA